MIDTKTNHGKIRRDWSGGLFVDKRTILRIDGRDQTELITGIENQIGYVRDAIAKLAPELEIDVVGALCFPDVDGLPLLRRIEIRSVPVDGPKRVAQLASRPGSLSSDATHRIRADLAGAFPTA